MKHASTLTRFAAALGFSVEPYDDPADELRAEVERLTAERDEAIRERDELRAYMATAVANMHRAERQYRAVNDFITRLTRQHGTLPN